MDAVLDPASSSLSRSKLLPPQPSASLPRPHLQALLGAPSARLVLFCAPAGFGKTTALAELAASRSAEGYASAWYSLGEGDDDPLHFLTQLIAALRSAFPGIGADALSYLRNTMQVPVAAVVESLLADLSEQRQPLLLVIDDVHLIQDPDLLAALNRMVLLGPTGFVLALGSRSLPALRLASLRAKGLLLEIGSDELRLSLEETGEYLRGAGLSVDTATVAALHAQTEGWLAGVHLASLWLHNRSDDAPMPRNVSELAVGDYLLSTVFEQLPEPLQEQLLALAVANQLSGELAGALIGCDDGQALLEELEQRQLFLEPLDRARHWYRFHHLFADFLRARLRQRDPERLKHLHFNASLWFTNHHMQNLAIEHACLAEDPEMLAALVDGCGLELINRGQLSQIYRWRQQIPDAIAERYPVLVLATVWEKAAGQSLPEAKRLLDELLQRWDAGEGAPLQQGYLAAMAVKALIALQKDELALCVELAGKVEARLGQHAAFLEVALLLVGALAQVMLARPEAARHLLALAQQRNHFLEGRYLAMQLSNVEVLLALEQGCTRQAQLLSERLRGRLMPWFGDRSRALALPAITESLIAYQQARYDGLEERLGRALRQVDVINPIDLYAQGLLFLSRLQRARNQTREALESLVLLQGLAVRNQSWRFQAQAVADEIALILQQPAADRIRRAEQRLKSLDWERHAAHYAAQPFNPVRWSLGVSRVRLQQARGQYSEALHEIAQLRELLQPGWHGVQRLRLEMLAALSHQRLGYQERALSTLVQCLIDAEREGLRSLFIEEGEAIRQMLQQLEVTERQPALQGFIRGLLTVWPGSPARETVESPGDDLTDREMEVIRLAATGMSNEEIGVRLALALGTVKWHLHNIYDKLKVRNRTHAIRRARELELLDA